MISGFTVVFSMITKVALVLIAGGLLWTVGRRLWERFQSRSKE